MNKINEYAIGTQKQKYFTRFWLKTRKIKNENIHEIYVPFYAWALELLHRLFFGRCLILDN